MQPDINTYFVVNLWTDKFWYLAKFLFTKYI